MNYEGAPGLEFGNGQTELDPSVLRHLPKDCKIIATERHGVSFWANTGRIEVELVNGDIQAFFIKVMSKETGLHMVESEFKSMATISDVLPDFVPKPIAWGTYETIPDTHFFLCEFREMIEEMPDPFKFAARLANLHSRGDRVGRWEVFFTKNFKKALDLEVAARGWDPEFDELVPAIFDKIILRLLRPLESDGRSVTPSLVHGDLWFANAGLDMAPGESLIFDACCFYAHNEYEFGQWRPMCNKFGAEYLDAYHTFVQISDPEEDYDERLDLYKLYGTFREHV